MFTKVELPKLSYGFGELKPFLSEEQSKIHYEKHHQAYVNATNAIMEKVNKARQESSQLDMKSELKSLSFNLSGHILHSLFWENLAPVEKGGGGEPSGVLLTAMNEEFGSFQRFKEEFAQAALSVEGSGWAALAVENATSRFYIIQIEKHNANMIPNMNLILVCDVFEHAYYLDYKNDRAKYIEGFWGAVNWTKIIERIKN